MRYYLCFTVLLLPTLMFAQLMHADLNALRSSPDVTTADNVKERLNGLRLYIRMLSYRGVDLNPVRQHYHDNRLNLPIDRLEVSDSLFRAIDQEFATLDSVQRAFYADTTRYYLALRRDTYPEIAPRPWPTLRGDIGQTAYTRQPGPVTGKLKWTFPLSHAWYSRPSFAEGTVYIGSPGVSYVAYAFDAATGEVRWKTPQKENQNQYKTPRQVSPAVVVNDRVVVRELGSGGSRGNARHLVFLDRKNGKEVGEVEAGHVDYRVGYAPFAANDRFLVIPHGRQEIGAGQQLDSVEISTFDSLVVRDAVSGIRLWSRYIGAYFGEPVLHNDTVLIGNQDGAIVALSATTGGTIWRRQTGAPVKGRPALSDDGVAFFTSDSGSVFALDLESGALRWERRLPVNDHAFYPFSHPITVGDDLFVGGADGYLYRMNGRNGDLIYAVELDDWVRAAPVATDSLLVVATMSGRVYGIDMYSKSGKVLWQTKVSAHPVLADLTYYRGGVFIASSDFYLTRIDADRGHVAWRQSVFERATEADGGPVLADLTGGGPDFQAGITVADSIAYVAGPRFVHAVHLSDGQEVWRYEVAGQVCGAPAVDDGRVYFGQQGGTDDFYCLDAASGELIWRRTLGWVWASATAAGGGVYVSSVAGNFYRCAREDGEIEWMYRSGQGAYPAPSLNDSLAFFGSWNGNFYAFDRSSGTLKWQRNIDGHPDSGASMVCGNLFFAQGFTSPYVYGLAADTGTERWRIGLRGEWCNAAPASNGEILLYSVYNGGPLHQAPLPSWTYAVDAETGALRYRLPFGGGLTGAVIANDLVFSASSTDPYLRAWDLRNGQLRWQYRLGGRVEESCPAIFGKTLLLSATDGFIYAFE